MTENSAPVSITIGKGPLPAKHMFTTATACPSPSKTSIGIVVTPFAVVPSSQPPRPNGGGAALAAVAKSAAAIKATVARSKTAVRSRARIPPSNLPVPIATEARQGAGRDRSRGWWQFVGYVSARESATEHHRQRGRVPPLRGDAAATDDEPAGGEGDRGGHPGAAAVVAPRRPRPLRHRRRERSKSRRAPVPVPADDGPGGLSGPRS